MLAGLLLVSAGPAAAQRAGDCFVLHYDPDSLGYFLPVRAMLTGARYDHIERLSAARWHPAPGRREGALTWRLFSGLAGWRRGARDSLLLRVGEGITAMPFGRVLAARSDSAWRGTAYYFFSDHDVAPSIEGTVEVQPVPCVAADSAG
jgi:hypothetical protein